LFDPERSPVVLSTLIRTPYNKENNPAPNLNGTVQLT